MDPGRRRFKAITIAKPTFGSEDRVFLIAEVITGRFGTNYAYQRIHTSEALIDWRLIVSPFSIHPVREDVKIEHQRASGLLQPLEIPVWKEKLKEAQTRQKSYADRHRRALEFQPGEHVFLKVSLQREQAFWYQGQA
ncbi:hypothetical protein Tco_1363043 [Tanacetum coccineum]